MISLESAPPLESVCIAPMRRKRTLIVNGVHLTSGDDRVKEAFAQSQLIPYSSEEAWIYGFGLGDLPRMLLQRPTLKRLNVVVMNRSISHAVISFEPQPWLDDPRVQLVYASDLPFIGQPFAVCPVELRMCDDDAMDIRDHVQELLNEDFCQLRVEMIKGQEQRQLEDNKPFLEKDACVTELFESPYDNYSSVVIMGGPSASRYYEWIKDQKDTIAASTMLKPLLEAGIVPAIVIAVDTMPSMIKHFEGIELGRLKDSSLVYGADISTEVLRLWPGPRYYAFIGRDLELGGSVVYPACDLAVKMGSKTVYLIGADFSYPNGNSHVDGAAMPLSTAGSWRPDAINGHGERVKSDPNLLSYRRELGQYALAHPDVKWVKLGREGLPVEGMQWME